MCVSESFAWRTHHSSLYNARDTFHVCGLTPKPKVIIWQRVDSAAIFGYTRQRIFYCIFDVYFFRWYFNNMQIFEFGWTQSKIQSINYGDKLFNIH